MWLFFLCLLFKGRVLDIFIVKLFGVFIVCGVYMGFNVIDVGKLLISDLCFIVLFGDDFGIL